MNIRAAILGPNSYTGLYLMQILLRHPQARITYLASRRDEPLDMRVDFPQLAGRLSAEVALCRPIDACAIAAAADVAFLCVPHKVAMEHVPALLDAGLRVIDLSADYRLTDPALYERVYQTPHHDPRHLAEAVYGLPELFRRDIPQARLVANPGCYPTGAILALGPLLKEKLVQPRGILINAASGVTGAGRAAKPDLHFPEQNESFYAYGTLGGHRHQPEIVQTLTALAGRPIDLLFVPHLLPLDRGILETMYLDPVDDHLTQQRLEQAYQNAYAHEPFVRLRSQPPNVKHVRDTNFCDLSVRLVETAAGRKVLAFSAIDNMIKGASGQAVQNMNLLFGQEETAGLL